MAEARSTAPVGALFLGFDVGTQGTKGVAFDPQEGRVVARAARAYGLIPGLPPGAAEQHPGTWIDALREVSRELANQVPLARVAGVGISGQQHGAVLLDADGRVVRPAKLWCDTTTAGEADRLSRALGRSIPAGFTAPKLVWVREHEPEAWGRTQHVLLPHDYVNYRLTGRMAMEPGDASGTGLFDPRARAFDTQALSVVDPRLAGMLPPLVRSDEAAGWLSKEGAALIGAPEGTLISSGGGDNMMSAIGSGATRPGVVVVSLGTSGTAFCHTPEPIVDPEGAIAPFCDSTGGYLPLLCTLNATSVTEEVRAAFAGEDAASLTAAAQRVPPGSDGLLFLPYLRGERVPDLPHATGALLGITPGTLDRGHLFRAALEGTTLALASGIERMRRLGIRVESVRLVGGGAQNPLWREIAADAFDAKVVGVEETESAAFGAALQALWAVRRAGGERVSADEIASAYVRESGPQAVPDAARVALYRVARARQEDATGRLFSDPKP